MWLFNLLVSDIIGGGSPPLNTTSDTNTSDYTPIFIGVGIVILVIIVIAILVFAQKHNNDNSDIPPDNAEQPTQSVTNNSNESTNNINSNTNSETQNQPPQPTQNIEQNQVAAQPPQKSGHGFLKFIIAAILICILVFGVIKIVDCSRSPDNKDGILSITSRPARKSDLTIYEPDDFLSAIFEGQVAFIPSSDINNLELTFTFYSSSKTVLVSQTKNIGNVTANTKFYVNFLDSLSVSESIKIVQSTSNDWQVTGGTVKYFS